MRRAAKVDANQPEIVAALEQAGASVLHLHTLGRGAPDICAGYRGRNYLMEIKTVHGKLTPDEMRLQNTWEGHLTIVRSVDEALHAIGAT